MKQEILKSVKIIVIALIIGVGVSYFSFKNAEKSSATGSCVSQGTSSETICKPINEGPTAQVKNGELSVGAFIARGNSKIASDTYIDGNLTVSGGDYTTGKVKIESLNGTGVRNVCACSNGRLIVCGTTCITNVIISDTTPTQGD